jgi:hypothetical protein
MRPNEIGSVDLAHSTNMPWPCPDARTLRKTRSHAGTAHGTHDHAGGLNGSSQHFMIFASGEG